MRLELDAVIAAIADPQDPDRWTVYDGISTPTAIEPFAVVHGLNDEELARSIEREDFGKRWILGQVTCVGATQQQSAWLADELKVLDMGGEWLERIGPVRDDTTSEDRYITFLGFRLLES